MRYPPALLDEIRARLSVSQVVSRRVKLKRAGKEFIGLSPFKQEKTPSFTVNDQKGFYHCFATGEHGDIFSFLIKTEGLSFPESVERLANEAGVTLPKSSPEAERRAEENDRLRDITAESAKFFSNCLEMDEAAHAREYLRQRGISRQQISEFRLGYAPSSREALKKYLKAQGFSIDDLIKSGMIIGGRDINNPYDRFRDRLIFPITDLKQRVIAFGGRALDEAQKAKYLNSPETPLFHKGQQLYNGAAARKAAYERHSVYVTEGYMDVIAMSGAGYQNTVAPLGTALTAEQITLLWRMAEEPILCFDGDQAGQKAAYRAVETALPLLKPGLSLKFAYLPEGQDPDDLLKSAGKEEMDSILKAAKPLSEVLWQKEYSLREWDTPERRAALEKNLLSLINGISDQTVRLHYSRDIKSRLWRAFKKSGDSNKFETQVQRSKSWQKNGKFQKAMTMSGFKQPASDSLMASPLLKEQASHKNQTQEALLLVLLMNHPWLLETEDEQVSMIKFTTQIGETLRDALLEVHLLENSLDREAIAAHLRKLDLSSDAARMYRIVAQSGPKYVDPDTDPKQVQDGWQELMMRHHKAEELRRELDAAKRTYEEEQNQQNFERLQSIKQALEQSLNELA